MAASIKSDPKKTLYLLHWAALPALTVLSTILQDLSGISLRNRKDLVSCNIVDKTKKN